MAELPTGIALEVATPLGKELSVETESVQVPSAAGQFGVLAGHVPLLAALKPGILTYKQEGKQLRAAVGGGYAEAGAGRVRLITEFFMRPEDVDLEDAQKDRAAAEAHLKELKATTEEVAYRDAERALQWAEARIELAGSASN
ncbi:MAG: ATP synthase F1 subunit epsilon [Myxococcales bacterium]|nr:ATP synthase F1 subunit epsilon [Myxococcales bacterium]